MDCAQSKSSLVKIALKLRTIALSILSLLVILIFQRCDPNTQILCTEEARAGLNINVEDGNNGLPLYDSVSIVIYDGSYQEILQPPYDFYYGNTQFSGAYERPGSYQIITSCVGYSNDTSYAVVTEDECHVISVTKTIKLYP